MTYILEMHIVDASLKPAYEAAIAKMATNEYRQNTHKDSGFDLYIPQDVEFGAFDTKLVDLGVRCAAYKLAYPAYRAGFFGGIRPPVRVPHPYYMYARSSISKTNFRLANNVGIIDSGYRGNLKAALDNAKPSPATLCAGTRLLQICMPDLSSFTVKLVSKLDHTKRGEQGFGSTGQ
jgi:dUTP pyrophosphatase